MEPGQSQVPKTAEHESGTHQSTLWTAQRFYRPYVKWALVVGLTLGFSTGTTMFLLPVLGIPVGQAWVTHTQAHGVAQIFGWAGLFLMGMAYHLLPRFRNGSIFFPWPQRAVLALVIMGVALRFVGQTFPLSGISPFILLASGGSLALGITLFVVVSAQTLRRGTSPHNPPEAWVWISLVWSLVAAGLQLAIATRMAFNNLLVAPYLLDGAFVHAALLGFIGNFIIGVSLRAIPAFMALPAPRLKLIWVAFLTINAGILLNVVGWLTGSIPWFITMGSLLQLSGFVAFIVGISLYARRHHPRVYTLGAYGRYEWYIRAAYGWLVVSGVLQAWNGVASTWPGAALPQNLAAPALHALAMGFVTMIIMGMAARMLPIFEGAILPLHRLMDVTFALLNASVILRIAFGIVPSSVAWAGLALSGSLGTIALACFAVVVWRTLHTSSRQKYADMARNLGQQQLSFVRRQRGFPESPPPP